MHPSDIGGLVAAADPAVSPDGHLVAFSVTTVDVDANRYRQRIWMGASDGSTPSRPFTGGDQGQLDEHGRFSPDGHWLAYTSRRADDGKATTLYVTPVAGGGETITLATMREAVAAPVWSPDGRWIAFTCRTPDVRYEITDERGQEPRRIRRLFWKLDGVGWIADRPSHIYVVPTDGTAPPRNLTPGEFGFDAPSWGPDSTWLVVSGRGHDEWDIDLAVDLYRVDLDGSPLERLTPGDGTYTLPSVAPDGSRVAFLGVLDPFTDPQNSRLGLLSLATSAVTWVADVIDRTKAPYPGAQAPIWTGEHLIFAIEDRGDLHLYRAAVDDSSPPLRLVAGERCVTSYDVAGGALAFTASSADRPAEVHTVLDGRERRVSFVTDAFCARVRPRPPDRFTSPSGDVLVDTWVYTPPDLDPARSYPALLNIHGGPFTQYGNRFFDEAQLQAHAGYVVIMSNPRGSSGRDTAWGRAIAGPKSPRDPGTGWGTVDADDVLATVDESLRRYPFIDPDRIGVLGGSYGGYLTSWLVTQTGRFKAACSERAVNNMLSEEWTSDIATAFRSMIGVSHLDDPGEYLRMSPITYADCITTPLLILHSENDLRCPIEQAEQLFIALRMRRRDVEFVRFPAEGHELSRSGSPFHRIRRVEILLEWFARKL